MLGVAIHFVIGSVAALFIFLAFTWLSGVRKFSAPSAVLFIGVTCGVLSHFVSPWATPVVLALYGVAAAAEYRSDRITAKQRSSNTVSHDPTAARRPGHDGPDTVEHQGAGPRHGGTGGPDCP